MLVKTKHTAQTNNVLLEFVTREESHATGLILKSTQLRMGLVLFPDSFVDVGKLPLTLDS